MLQPYFLRNVPATHLCNITRIQLAYDERTAAFDTFSDVHISEHCAPCNIDRWLTLIRDRLTDVREIDVFIYPENSNVRRFSDIRKYIRQPWTKRILALQHHQGLRQLRMHVRFDEPTIVSGVEELLEGLFQTLVVEDGKSKDSLRHSSPLCQHRAGFIQA